MFPMALSDLNVVIFAARVGHENLDRFHLGCSRARFPVTANSSKVRTEREGVEEKGNGKRY